MKKIISATLIALALTFMPMGTYANAAYAYKTVETYCNETVIYQDSDFIITESDISNNSTFSRQTFSVNSTKKQKTVSKNYNIKNTSGVLYATFTLNATFVYNGKTASCIKSSHSFSIKNKNASFTSASSSKSGSTATGKYSVKIKDSGKSVSKTVSIKCSKNGTIS